jgi:hypothetical protein
LSRLGLSFNSVSDAVATSALTDLSNFADSQVLVWQTGARDLMTSEYDALTAWVAAGKTLVVTGPDSLSNSQCYHDLMNAGDDDDSAAGDDDDSAAGDDDDSAAGDDDDSAAAPGCESEEAVNSALMSSLIQSITSGDGPDNVSCAVSDTTTPMTLGPYGTYSTALTFSAADSNHENAVANTAAGAVRVVSVGSKAKVIYRAEASGGRVIFWNGDGVADWAAEADAANLMLNAITSSNLGCGGLLQGGDCDDSDATLFPGTCN